MYYIHMLIKKIKTYLYVYFVLFSTKIKIFDSSSLLRPPLILKEEEHKYILQIYAPHDIHIDGLMPKWRNTLELRFFG